VIREDRKSLARAHANIVRATAVRELCSYRLPSAVEPG